MIVGWGRDEVVSIEEVKGHRDLGILWMLESLGRSPGVKVSAQDIFLHSFHNCLLKIYLVPRIHLTSSSFRFLTCKMRPISQRASRWGTLLAS